jgi:glycosyltransferase involved in cell wall biosynthesis
MKILHYEAGKKLYGGAYQVVGLIERLQSDAEHHLFCARGSKIAETVAGRATVHASSIASDLDPRPYWALTKLLRAEKPDLLHIHSRRGADFWGPLAARKTGTPFLVSRRVDNLEPGWLIRRKFRGAERLIGISQRICGAMLEMGLPADRIVCLRSGVDTVAFQPRAKTRRLHEELKLHPEAILVGMAAQFIARKGHDDLVAAARTIIQTYPHAVFILFGQGSLRASIKERTGQLGIASSFRFPGFREDLPAVLPELDIFVHPAHLEGLGVAVLQASACGLPVVGTRAGGIPEIVQDEKTGFLVPPRTPPALAAAISALLKDPRLRETMGAAGRAFVVQACSLDATAEGNGRLYREVLDALEGK